MFDVVVIGGGPGGYVAAIRAAQRGAKVALVESRDIGGTCLNRGCIPTKALVRSAEVYQNVLGGAEFGARASGVELDFAQVMARKRQVVKKLASGVEYLLKANGVHVYPGRAAVPKPGVVEVALRDGGAERLETKNIIIATGSGPALPPVSPESLKLTISSDDALELERPPQSMVVIGGGVLGVEFACIYAAFGTKVDIIKRSPLILPPVDDEIAQRMAPLLRKINVTITTGIYVKEIKRRGDMLVLCAEKKDAGPVEFAGEKILVAMGRVPDFGGLGLEGLGVAHDARGIKVDGRMRTSVPGIYATGDVVGRFHLASVASAEGLCAADDITGHGRDMDYAVVPACVFSRPEAASVGLKEREAREQGIDITVGKFMYGANGKALALGEPDGMVKVIARKGDGKVIGVHILGAQATDLIHEPALALKMGATVEDVAMMIHAHPTLSEIVMEAFHGAAGQAIHQAPARR